MTQGILHRGDAQKPQMVCEIWSKDKEIRQSVIITQRDRSLLTAEQEASAKSILASLEYMKTDVPAGIELTKLINGALRRVSLQ